MNSIARFLGIGSDKTDAEKVTPTATPTLIDVEPPSVDSDDSVGEIRHVRREEIRPNPFQPRKTFHTDSLQELAVSIREFGILQPLIVRNTDDGLELIAGERRLRASKLAGLETVPVIVRSISDKEVAELAMIENLQREDLHFLEEAEGYHQLILQFGLTQEEMARRVGKNQSTIANKLRLLKLDADVRENLRIYSLTERHARALLKLEDPQLQRETLEIIKTRGLNVRETEIAIDEMIGVNDKADQLSAPAARRNVIRLIKDVRIFLNSIRSLVADMKKAGLSVKLTEEQDEDEVTLVLKIAKKK